MEIIKTTRYKQDFKKKILKKNLIKEQQMVQKIETFLLSVNNFQEMLNHPFKNVYKIEKKSGNLKRIYTAHINGSIRLFIKPVVEFTYDLNEINKIEFVCINNKHYKE